MKVSASALVTLGVFQVGHVLNTTEIFIVVIWLSLINDDIAIFKHLQNIVLYVMLAGKYSRRNGS